MLILWLLCTSWCALAIGDRPEPYVIENATVYFNGFMTEYSKTYANVEEKNSRLEIFKKNLEAINRLNEDPNGAIYGIDETTDLTAEEYNERTSCLLDTSDEDTTVSGIQCTVLNDKDITAKDAPPTYSWRDQGAVTKVRNQGSCRSCWAMVATGQLEGRNYMKHKKLVQLSPQQLVDCDRLSNGCRGGTMVKAYRSLIGSIHGCWAEEDYPYVARSETCRMVKKKPEVIPVRCSSYNLKSQDKVRQQLHKIGPIGIAVRNDGLRFYKQGIIQDSKCSEGGLSHAVLLVGYGIEKGEDYWLVKNSRGVKFGEEGYFRMQRGEDHTSCGMMNTYMSTASIE